MRFYVQNATLAVVLLQFYWPMIILTDYEPGVTNIALERFRIVADGSGVV